MSSLDSNAFELTDYPRLHMVHDARLDIALRCLSLAATESVQLNFSFLPEKRHDKRKGRRGGKKLDRVWSEKTITALKVGAKKFIRHHRYAYALPSRMRHVLIICQNYVSDVFVVVAACVCMLTTMYHALCSCARSRREHEHWTCVCLCRNGFFFTSASARHMHTHYHNRKTTACTAAFMVSGLIECHPFVWWSECCWSPSALCWIWKCTDTCRFHLALVLATSSSRWCYHCVRCSSRTEWSPFTVANHVERSHAHMCMLFVLG